MTSQQRIFFSKHRCGIEDGEIKVCCPRETGSFHSRINLDSDLLPSIRECDNTLIDRIVGGNVTKITDFPSMVLIKYSLRKF